MRFKDFMVTAIGLAMCAAYAPIDWFKKSILYMKKEVFCLSCHGKVWAYFKRFEYIINPTIERFCFVCFDHKDFHLA